MGSEPESIVLQHLRAIRNDIAEMRGDFRSDLHDLKVRTSAIEQGVGVIHNRIDRVEIRLDRIEKRLDLVDA